MKTKLTILLLLLGAFGAHAQMMSKEYAYLKKYMGVNVFAGYTYNQMRHASLDHFATSFNTVFEADLQTKLQPNLNYSAPVIGIEISAAAIRIGYRYFFAAPRRFEARYKDGSIRKMELRQPKNNWYFDLLLPIAKGRAFVGMTLGTDFGYYRLHSYQRTNFGRDLYANNDGLSGIFKSHLNINGRLGARLEVQVAPRVRLGVTAEWINKIIGGDESKLTGWKDEFYTEGTLGNMHTNYIYLPEDVTHRQDEFVFYGNTQSDYYPVVHSNPKGVSYAVTLNVQAFSFNRNKKN